MWPTGSQVWASNPVVPIYNLAKPFEGSMWLFRRFHKAMVTVVTAGRATHLLQKQSDRIQTGMDSPNEAMAPDEMYLMLQADMITIKEQEQVFQSELDDISSKFRHLLEACGIDSDGGSGTMAPPSTPSFMKTAAESPSLTYVTNLDNVETPTFLKQTPGKSTLLNLSDSSDDENRSLFPCEMDSIAVVNSSDGLPLDISNLSSKTLLVDRNSNYLESPHSEVTDNNTPIIEAIPSLDKTSPSTTNSSSSSGGSSSHRMSSSSDGYPKSDDSSDNQVVPECYDLDREFMSRLKYYSDFTLDRQRKINTMVTHLGSAPTDNEPSSVTEDLFTRHVEGKESSPEKPFFVKPNVVYPATTLSSSGSYVSTPTSRHHSSLPRDRSHRPRSSRSGRRTSSRPLLSSTMLEDSFSSSSSGRGSNRGNGHSVIPAAMSTVIYESESSSGSSRRNRTGGSNPQACSTMLNESFLSSGSGGSGSSRHRSSSIPMANSTMISEAPDMISCGAEPTVSIISRRPNSRVMTMNHYSDNDCESVYTWSIHDDESGSDRDISLEESYMKKVTNSHKKFGKKPPLPPLVKHVRSGSNSSRESDSEHVCQDHRLHELLGEKCSKDILESISAIEPNDTCREGALFVESLFEDATDGAVCKTNSIPRSSTRLKLQDKSSGSSSMDAKCASLPDLTAVSTNNGVPESSASGSDDNPLRERLSCQGKSSSSNDNPSRSASANEPSSQFSQGSANIDSILTDSPNSVCSGINAPYNSPGTNVSSSSKVSCSTTSDAKSSDSNINTRAPLVTLLPHNSPMPSPVKSPKLQNVNGRKSKSPGGNVFKIPRQNLPLRNLFRFKRKSKTPDPKKTSTPLEVARTGAADRPISKRQLFPSSGTANLQQEVKVKDKKAMIKKFKRFSDNFGKKDKTGRPKIETLANL